MYKRQAQTYFNKTLEQLSPAEAATLASLPKAPSDFHPVRNKDRLVERRNYVLNEMAQNGYLDPAVAKAAAAEPLLTVQNGDFPAFRTALPPRDYFTDEIRRQLSGTFGQEEFFGVGLSIRPTIDPELQELASRPPRRGLEKYDRNQGVWRGTGKTQMCIRDRCRGDGGYCGGAGAAAGPYGRAGCPWLGPAPPAGVFGPR